MDHTLPGAKMGKLKLFDILKNLEKKARKTVDKRKLLEVMDMFMT